MTSTFAFEALTKEGGVERGLLRAASADGARAQLTARGLIVLALADRPTREGKTHVGARDLATGLRILANLASAGLPLTRVLRAFEDLAPPAWRQALPTIADQITQGATLAAALENSPLDVPPLILGVVRAGEAGAGIGAGLEHAAAMAESTAELRGALRAAVAYPMVVAAAGLGSISVLLTVVLPRFAAILADFQQQMPPATRFVLAMATAAPRILVVASVAGTIAFAVWFAWTSTAPGKRRWAALLLSTPGIGTVQRATSTARVTMSLAALLKSGVPIASAMSLAGRASGNAAIEYRVGRARDRVNGGASLADALSAEHAVTVAAARLAKAGEEGGGVPAMLAHAGNLERDRAERIVRTSVRLLEPVLLLLFAGVVGVIAAALLQAVYSIRPTG